MGGLAIRATATVIFVAAALVLLGPSRGLGTAAIAAGTCDVDGSQVSLDADEQEMVRLLNEYRAARGLAKLTVSANLQRSATWMATDMATKGYFSHTDAQGRDASSRANDCGYPFAAGENIAAGGTRDTGVRAFDLLVDSPAHAKNMLVDYYVQVGVARVYVPNSPYGWYWVQALGVGDDGTRVSLAAPAPTPTPQPTPASQPTQSATTLRIPAGSNLVTWAGPSVPVSQAAAMIGGSVDVIYAYDVATRTWKRYGADLPVALNTLGSLERGSAYWFISAGPLTLPASP